MQQITSLGHFMSLSMREGIEGQLLVIAFQSVLLLMMRFTGLI